MVVCHSVESATRAGMGPRWGRTREGHIGSDQGETFRRERCQTSGGQKPKYSQLQQTEPAFIIRTILLVRHDTGRYISFQEARHRDGRGRQHKHQVH